MRRRNPFLGCLTLLLYAATALVVVVVAAWFAVPGLIPGPLRPATEPVPGLIAGLTIDPTATAPLRFPTLPPEWTATPTAPATNTRTPDRFPSATATQPLGSPATELPNLSGTDEAGVDARVAADATFLRVRALPGTAGEIIGALPALTEVRIIGRTPEDDWLEVMAPDNVRGWVQAEFLDVYINLLAVPVTAGAVLDATATNVAPGEAQVKADGGNLRLRQSPGTAGAVLANLPAGMSLDLVGRTADNVWLQVITSDNQRGWVMTQFVDVFISLNSLPVTGTAVDAPTAAPTSQPAAGLPPAATQVAAAPTVPPTLPPPTLPPPTPVPPTATYTQPPPPTATASPPPPVAPPLPGDLLLGLTERAREIYLAGQARGNRANVFAKVGDSITVSPQFLTPIGYGQFNLRDYGHLVEVVNFYGGGWARTGNAFANTSLAAKGGWTTFSVLAGSLSDKAHCGLTESPLLCEYRLTRPAVALIMLGTNDVLGTNDEAYLANLRRIVADTVGQGILPVLSTIPPFLRAGYEARADQLNALILAVAQESEVPVWNFWAALQPLPNRGMSSDGVHPAWAPNATDFTPENLQYGSTMRNLTALQVLDALWRQVMYP